VKVLDGPVGAVKISYLDKSIRRFDAIDPIYELIALVAEIRAHDPDEAQEERAF
jgi:hypothetical protein